ncbi:MAG: class I SAM-dependent methyltransferase [Magnetococcales bacterium]|nr:class I SAM-dependent methyltransferase [Magnetococcales bacterium]
MKQYMQMKDITRVVSQMRASARREVAQKVLTELLDDFFTLDAVSQLRGDDDHKLAQALDRHVISVLHGPDCKEKESLCNCLGWTSSFDQLFPPLWILTNLTPPRDQWFALAITMIPLDALGTGRRILDFGAGPGTLAQFLALCGLAVQVTVIEPSPHWRAYLRSLNLENLVIPDCSEASSLPLSNDEFDGVWSFMVFHHIQNNDERIAEISRSLKPGGWFVVVEKIQQIGGNEAQAFFQSQSDILYKELILEPNSSQQPHSGTIPEYVESISSLIRSLKKYSLRTMRAFRLSSRSFALEGRHQHDSLQNMEESAYWAIQNLKKCIRKISLGLTDATGEINNLLDRSEQVFPGVVFKDVLTKQLGIVCSSYMILRRHKKTISAHYESLVCDSCPSKIVVGFPKNLDSDTLGFNLIDQAVKAVSDISPNISDSRHLAERKEWFRMLHDGGLLITKSELDDGNLDMLPKKMGGNGMIASDGTFVAANSWDDNPGVFIFPAIDSILVEGLLTNTAIIAVVVLKSWHSYTERYPELLQPLGDVFYNTNTMTTAYAKILGWVRAIMEVAARPVAEAHFYPDERNYQEALGQARTRADAFRNAGHLMANRIFPIQRRLDNIFDANTNNFNTLNIDELKTAIRYTSHDVKSLYSLFSATRLWGFSNWDELFNFYRDRQGRRNVTKIEKFLCYTKDIDLYGIFNDVIKICQKDHATENTSLSVGLNLTYCKVPLKLVVKPTISDPDYELCTFNKDVVWAIIYEIFLNALNHGVIIESNSCVSLEVTTTTLNDIKVVIFSNNYVNSRDNDIDYISVKETPSTGLGMVYSLLRNFDMGNIWYKREIVQGQAVYRVALHIKGIDWNE